MAGVALAGLLASSAGYLLFHGAAAPDGSLPPNTVRPVPDTDEQATRAKVVLASLDRQLDDVKRSEAQLTSSPPAGGGSDTPPAVQALQARKAALIEQRERVAAQLSALQPSRENQRVVAQAGPGRTDPVAFPKPDDQLARDIAGLGAVRTAPGPLARDVAGLHTRPVNGERPAQAAASPAPVDRTAPVVATASGPLRSEPAVAPVPAQRSALSDRAPAVTAPTPLALDELLAPRTGSPAPAIAPREQSAGSTAALPSPSDRPSDGFFPTGLARDLSAGDRPVGTAERPPGASDLAPPTAQERADAPRPQSKLELVRARIAQAQALAAADENRDENGGNRPEDSTTDDQRIDEREIDQRGSAERTEDETADDRTEDRDNRDDRDQDDRSRDDRSRDNGGQDDDNADTDADPGTDRAGSQDRAPDTADQRVDDARAGDRADASGLEQRPADGDPSDPRQGQPVGVADPTSTDDRSSEPAGDAPASAQRSGNDEEPDAPARRSGADTTEQDANEAQPRRDQSEQNQSEQDQSEQNQSEQNQSEQNQPEQNQPEQNQSGKDDPGASGDSGPGDSDSDNSNKDGSAADKPGDSA